MVCKKEGHGKLLGMTVSCTKTLEIHVMVRITQSALSENEFSLFECELLLTEGYRTAYRRTLSQTSAAAD
jgi:hypothetical protein